MTCEKHLPDLLELSGLLSLQRLILLTLRMLTSLKLLLLKGAQGSFLLVVKIPQLQKYSALFGHQSFLVQRGLLISAVLCLQADANIMEADAVQPKLS